MIDAVIDWLRCDPCGDWWIDVTVVILNVAVVLLAGFAVVLWAIVIAEQLV